MFLLENPVAGAHSVGGQLAGMPTRNWVGLRQPFLNLSGPHPRACVSIHDIRGPGHPGSWTKNDSKGGERRPLIRTYTMNELAARGMPMPLTTNAATLTKQQWQQLDAQVMRSYLQRLRLVSDLESAVPYGGFNAMGKMTLEYQAMSDPGEAVVDMDATTDARNDTPLHIIRSVPLAITHADFGFSDRELQVSRSGPIPMPLDTTMGEVGGRRVAESLEDQAIGNVTGVTYGTVAAGPGTHTGTSTIYGLRNFPQRLTKTNMTVPTGSNPDATVLDVLTMIKSLQDQFSFGPFMLYHSTDWSQYLDNDYVKGTAAQGLTSPSVTLRDRLRRIDGISDIRRLDRLTATLTMILVAMDPMVIQMVNGMEITTIQWQEKGGLEHRFKVMAIKVPRLRSDYSNRTGILHGTTT